MKIAYFDCAYGAAGDMLCAALIAAGLSVEDWLKELDKIALPPGSFEVEVSDVIRCSLAAKKVDVLYEKHSHEHVVLSDDHGHAHGHTHEHSHEHAHSHESAHEHLHEHAHTDEHSHALAHEHARSLPEILEIIEKSDIAPRAKKLSAEIFETLGYAEAKVHGMPVENVHFHEVGAVDAIVDIVGFAIGYDMLQIEASTVSSLPVGSGHVKSAHGLYPVPGPAVINMLTGSNIAIASSPFTHECLTPTGAAILCTVAKHTGPMPSMNISSAGYGAGTFDPKGFPNVCRLIIGQSIEAKAETACSTKS